MRKDPDVIVPYPPPGDITMCIVENRYRRKHDNAPRTPYLLIVQAFNAEEAVIMVRVMGISKQAKNGFDSDFVPFVETNASVEERLNEFFSINWEQVGSHFQRFTNGRPVPQRVQ